MKQIKIGLIGWGTIGTGVLKLWKKNRALRTRRLGAELVVSRVADIDLKRKRGIRVHPSRLTKDARRILDDPEIDIVIELTGGIKPAEEYIIRALRAGKQVVTANKALLAERGRSLFSFAKKSRRRIFYEAAVGGGIPLIKVLKEGLVANRIKSILGIINGTSNYILTRMAEDDIPMEVALAEARANGYAELDPTLDLQGIDSAHKLVILASLAFGGWIDLKKVYVEGIRKITNDDIRFTAGLGYVIKLLAIAKQDAQGVEIRVHPTLLPVEHLLASVRGVYNAVSVEGDFSGPNIFHGQGAGERPTASAVAADLVEAGREVLSGNYGGGFSFESSEGFNILPIGDVLCQHYVNIPAVDHPGVLARISSIFSKFDISIASVIQRERRKRGVVPIILMTHKAREKDLQRALSRISRLAQVKGRPLRLRVEA